MEAEANVLTVAMLTYIAGIQFCLLPNCVDDYYRNVVNMIFFQLLKYRHNSHTLRLVFYIYEVVQAPPPSIFKHFVTPKEIPYPLAGVPQPLFLGLMVLPLQKP